MQHLADRPLRLCFLSHRHLSTLAEPVFAEYAGRVEIEVVEANFEGFRSIAATMALAMALSVAVAARKGAA